MIICKPVFNENFDWFNISIINRYYKLAYYYKTRNQIFI